MCKIIGFVLHVYNLKYREYAHNASKYPMKTTGLQDICKNGHKQNHYTIIHQIYCSEYG